MFGLGQGLLALSADIDLLAGDPTGRGELLVLVGNDCFSHENSGDDEFDDALGDDDEDDDEEDDDVLTVAVVVEIGGGCSDVRICDDCDCDCDCACDCG